ncbi:MAG: hypothetical protein KTR14_06220 [Vampirovibrio sp.]|nr:hypothetical protein [Vampirovibrio sp.]
MDRLPANMQELEPKLELEYTWRTLPKLLFEFCRTMLEKLFLWVWDSLDVLTWVFFEPLQGALKKLDDYVRQNRNLHQQKKFVRQGRSYRKTVGEYWQQDTADIQTEAATVKGLDYLTDEVEETSYQAEDILDDIAEEDCAQLPLWNSEDSGELDAESGLDEPETDSADVLEEGIEIQLGLLDVADDTTAETDVEPSIELEEDMDVTPVMSVEPDEEEQEELALKEIQPDVEDHVEAEDDLVLVPELELVENSQEVVAIVETETLTSETAVLPVSKNNAAEAEKQESQNPAVTRSESIPISESLKHTRHQKTVLSAHLDDLFPPAKAQAPVDEGMANIPAEIVEEQPEVMDSAKVLEKLVDSTKPVGLEEPNEVVDEKPISAWESKVMNIIESMARASEQKKSAKLGKGTEKEIQVTRQNDEPVPEKNEKKSILSQLRPRFMKPKTTEPVGRLTHAPQTKEPKKPEPQKVMADEKRQEKKQGNNPTVKTAQVSSPTLSQNQQRLRQAQRVQSVHPVKPTQPEVKPPMTPAMQRAIQARAAQHRAEQSRVIQGKQKQAQQGSNRRETLQQPVSKQHLTGQRPVESGNLPQQRVPQASMRQTPRQVPVRNSTPQAHATGSKMHASQPVPPAAKSKAKPEQKRLEQAKSQQTKSIQTKKVQPKKAPSVMLEPFSVGKDLPKKQPVSPQQSQAAGSLKHRLDQQPPQAVPVTAAVSKDKSAGENQQESTTALDRKPPGYMPEYSADLKSDVDKYSYLLNHNQFLSQSILTLTGQYFENSGEDEE